MPTYTKVPLVDTQTNAAADVNTNLGLIESSVNNIEDVQIKAATGIKNTKLEKPYSVFPVVINVHDPTTADQEYVRHVIHYDCTLIAAYACMRTVAAGTPKLKLGKGQGGGGFGDIANELTLAADNTPAAFTITNPTVNANDWLAAKVTAAVAGSADLSIIIWLKTLHVA